MTYYSHSQEYSKDLLSRVHPVGIDYKVRNERDRKDVTKFGQNKVIEWIRADWGAPYGFTYIGHNKIWLNESLKETPEFKYEVDVHECGHCPIESVTRYISREQVKEESREEIIKKLPDKDDNDKYDYLYCGYSKN